MCYGSGCKFEDSMGDCTVMSDYNLFHEIYKISPCAVGGSRAQMPEEELNDPEIEKQMEIFYKRYKEDKEKEKKKKIYGNDKEKTRSL